MLTPEQIERFVLMNKATRCGYIKFEFSFRSLTNILLIGYYIRTSRGDLILRYIDHRNYNKHLHHYQPGLAEKIKIAEILEYTV